MSYTLRFRPEVVTDLDDAARWYDKRRAGLSAEFLREARETLDRIAEQPEQVAADAAGIRSVRLHRFPYGREFAATTRSRGRAISSW